MFVSQGTTYVPNAQLNRWIAIQLKVEVMRVPTLIGKFQFVTQGAEVVLKTFASFDREVLRGPWRTRRVRRLYEDLITDYFLGTPLWRKTGRRKRGLRGRIRDRFDDTAPRQGFCPKETPLCVVRR